MVKTITKKSSRAIAPSGTGDDADDFEPAQKEDDPEPTAPESSIEINFNQEKGEAVFSLESGIEVVMTEPKAKDFIYLASRMETAPAWQRSSTMAAYTLAHFMITSWDGAIAQDKLPDFEAFMDELGDRDLERIGAALSCFPNIGARISKLFSAQQSSG